MTSSEDLNPDHEQPSWQRKVAITISPLSLLSWVLDYRCVEQYLQTITGIDIHDNTTTYVMPFE
jgi:hypothetical protein